VAPIIEQHRIAVEALCRRFHVDRLDVIGSAAGDGFDPDASDIDLLVRFGWGEDAKPADDYFGLLNGLRDTFGRDIDLVVEEAIANPYFRQTIEARRVRFFEAA